MCQPKSLHIIAQQYLPTTMTLKLKPLRTLLRCHWFGRLAKPTYPVSFLRTMFLLSAVAVCEGTTGLESETGVSVSTGTSGLPMGGETGVAAGVSVPSEAKTTKC